MYRNCNMMCNTCNCHNSCKCNNPVSNNNENILESICDNVVQSQNINYNDCSCGFDEEEMLFPSNPVFGQSYVPNQVMTNTFLPCVGLKMGTIFPELVSPYSPCQSIDEINFIAETNQIKEGCNNV